jgi:hypothetical protein
LTALVSWAHDPNPGIGADAWRDAVLDLVTGLRQHGGVDADVDLFHFSDPDVDWTRWGPRAAQDRDLVLVAVNRAWCDRWEGRNNPCVGAGAVAEADVLHGQFDKNQDGFQRRVVLILLPGASEQDIPDGLRRLRRVQIDDCRAATMTALARQLRNEPDYVPVHLTPAPDLSTTATEPGRPLTTGSPDAAHRAVTYTRNVAESLTISDHAQALVSRPEQLPALEIRSAVLRSAQRQLSPTPVGADAPRALELRSDIAQQLEGLSQQVAALRAEATAASAAPRVTQTTSSLMARVRPDLESDVAAWLLLAAVPQDMAGQDARGARGTVEQIRQRLQQWQIAAAPVVSLDFTTAAHRDAGRVVFTGRPTHTPHRDGPSGRWRLEFDDDGSSIIAAALPDAPHTKGGSTGWAGQPGQVQLDATLVLPVRRDQFELWLLTALDLIADRLTDAPSDNHLELQTALACPIRLDPLGHRLQGTTMHLLDSGRDPDQADAEPRRTPGGRDREVADVRPPSRIILLEQLADLPTRIQLARDLALQILDHFGIEDTAVLQRTGTIEPRAAGLPDQQQLHQYAVLHGLPIDELSPATRLDQATKLRAQARALLAPP